MFENFLQVRSIIQKLHLYSYVYYLLLFLNIEKFQNINLWAKFVIKENKNEYAYLFKFEL